MLKPSLLCNIQKLLAKLIDILIAEMGINRFPNLTKDIKEYTNNNLLKESTKETNNKNKKSLMMKNYVWTDDEDFVNQLHHISNKDKDKDKDR